jgi:hypothetical protein
MALVNQKMNTRQGQANYVLYQLASGENFSQCNGSNTSGLPSNSCVFNDVTVGTNTVPAGPGYQASTGYDLASGLGSVNVTNLVYQWGSSAGFTGTYYEIVNRGSGKALDVHGESTADGAGVEQWDFWNGPNQLWQLVPVDSVYYRIVSLGSGKVLDVTGMSTGNGAGIEQWSYWAGSNQQWQLVPTDSGYYRIVSKNSGKVLDVNGQSTSNGAAIQQWDFWGGFNQQWQLVPAH